MDDRSSVSYLDISANGIKRETLIKIVLMIELEKMGKVLSSRELDILSLLYMQGGINSSDEMLAFSKACYDKNLSREDSPQSIRNVLTKARSYGIVKRKTVNNWKLSFIPDLNSEYLLVKCLLTDNVYNK